MDPIRPLTPRHADPGRVAPVLPRASERREPRDGSGPPGGEGRGKPAGRREEPGAPAPEPTAPEPDDGRPHVDVRV